MRSLLVAAAATVACTTASAAEPIFEDTIAQRMQACVVCHGERGGGVAAAAFPRLAGQPAAYLVAQMKAFRDGVRTYAPMNYLMSRQTDAYFAEIADYFAAQKPDARVIDARRRTPVDAAVAEAGMRLVRNGRPEAGLPACTACHGVGLGGTQPSIPALAGLPRDFMIEQVGSWKNGTHRSPAPNCMAEVAKRMTGADIVEAATWLALQQPERGPEVRSAPLPLACGTE